MVNSEGRSYGQASLYGLPIVAQAILSSPILLLGGIYARYYGLSLSTIAGIMLFSRVFDAVTDPLIGGCSDYLYRKTGTRKHIIAVGASLYAISAWFLFVPPSDGVSAVYFLLWFFAFYLGATLFNIPYLAWASEFSLTVENRSFIFSAYFMGSQLGGLLFYLVPFLPCFGNTELTPDVLKVATLIGVGLLIPALFIALRYLPSGSPLNQVGREVAVSQSLFSAVCNYLSSFTRNKLFQLYITIYMLEGLALGTWLGLFFIFVDSYLGQGEAFASISLVSFGVGAVSAMIAKTLISRFGSRNTWGFSIGSITLCFIITGLLSPSLSSNIALIIIYSALIASSAVFSIAGLALLSSISDYGTLKTRQENAAGYFAAMTLLAKLQMALGTGLGLLIIDWFGFTATGADAIQSAGGVWGIKVAICVLPTVFGVMALILLTRLPLNNRRVGTIARAIARRRSRLSTQSVH